MGEIESGIMNEDAYQTWHLASEARRQERLASRKVETGSQRVRCPSFQNLVTQSAIERAEERNNFIAQSDTFLSSLDELLSPLVVVEEN